MRFSPEQDLLRRSVSEYARTEIAPRIDEWSVEGRLPRSAVRSLAALGAQGLLIDEAHGGMGAGLVEAGIFCEELGRIDPPLTLYVQLPAIVARILAGAEPAVADRWLPAIADGSATPCFALSEPGSGSDAAALGATARREGDEWVLSGEKASSSLAPEADIAVVFARTGGPGPRGISTFAVPLDLPGVGRAEVTSSAERVTTRGSIFLDDVRIPADHLVGTEDGGFVHAMAAFDFNRALIALVAVAGALEVIDRTVEHTKARETFGRPLAARQGIAFPLAEHVARLTATRSLAYEVLERAEAGLPHTAEAAMVKWMGPKDAVDAAHTCLLFHGWAGLDEHLGLTQRMLDLVAFEIGDGTAEIMKAVVARDLTGVTVHR